MKAIAAVMLSMAMVFAVGCNPEDEPNNETVTVTTITPSDITTTTAVCGAEVAVSEGVILEELGVCWGLQENPTANEEHLSTAQWNEPFTCTLTELNPNTVYHVRAYAQIGSDYYYGADKTFTTEEDDHWGNGTYNGHDYIDLELPSRTLWAACNVGAETPEGYGYYIPWADTEQKEYTHWNTYKYCNGDKYQLTKYCSRSDCGFEGYTDELTILLPEDDAATANWGEGWCMPSKEQWVELYQHTEHSWTTQNGVNGTLFTGSNGNTLFLPAAGSYQVNYTIHEGESGLYWSSSLFTEFPWTSWYFIFNLNGCGWDGTDRYAGFSIRPVLSIVP